MTFVKFCGLTHYEDARDAIDLGVDALGFNFYPSSPRSLSVPDAQTIVRRLPPDVWRVGVFVNYTKEQVQQIAREVGLDTLQFHGDEDISFLDGWEQWRTIRAVRLGKGSRVTLAEIKVAQGKADHLLFDSFSAEQFGGTGEQISENQTAQFKTLLSSSLLAGGITPENVAQKIAQYAPWGIDVASGIEAAPGKKSFAKMKKLMDEVKSQSRGV